jgi:hypothetical protein
MFAAIDEIASLPDQTVRLAGFFGQGIRMAEEIFFSLLEKDYFSNV